MNNKNLIFNDNVSLKEETLKFAYEELSDGAGNVKGTQVIFTDSNGKTHIEHNKQIISGAQFAAMKYFGLDKLVDFPNYNEELGIDEIGQLNPDNDHIISLFCVGKAGCGVEYNQVYPVEYAGRISPDNMVPFRYEDASNDLPPEQRNIYFGRKELDNGKIAYYYKAFETDPQMHIEYVDGTAIGSSLYQTQTGQKAVTYVEVSLKITKSDCRDFFIQTDTLGNARINQLSLIAAWHKTGEDGYEYYMNPIPITQLNFPNEPLLDLTRSISILYRIFF